MSGKIFSIFTRAQLNSSEMMIIWYLTIWTESYLHISHLIFDIIHPSLPQGDRRSRAANGKNRFDNSILIHYILLHARGRACFESKMTRWFPRGRVYLTRRESGVISSHSRHNMHTLLSQLEMFSDPGDSHSDFLQTQFSSSAGAECGYSDNPALADTQNTQNQLGRVRDISWGKWDINCAVKLKH